MSQYPISNAYICRKYKYPPEQNIRVDYWHVEVFDIELNETIAKDFPENKYEDALAWITAQLFKKTM